MKTAIYIFWIIAFGILWAFKPTIACFFTALTWAALLINHILEINTKVIHTTITPRELDNQRNNQVK